MKRIVLLAFMLLVCALSAYGRGHIQGTATFSQSVVTAGTTSSNKFGRILASATVTVYCPSGTTTVCTIYSDAAGTPKSNPFTAGSDGSFSFYTDAPAVDIRFSGVTGVSPFTLSDIPVVAGTSVTTMACGGSNDTAALSAANTAGGTIVIPKGITCASNSQTISATLRVDNGGLLKPITGQTVTLTGYPDIGLYQAFTNGLSGQGTISFAGNVLLKEVYASWWGPISSGIVDAKPAIQAANDAMPAAGGVLALTTGVYLINSPINLGQFVILRGQGYQGTEIRAGIAAAWSGAAMIQNKFQDGTQQMVAVERLFVNGNKSVAVAPIGILFQAVGQISYVRDVVITSVNGNGVVFDATGTTSAAGFYANNVWVISCAGDNIIVTGPIQAVTLDTITTEFILPNKRGIYLHGTGVEGHQGIWLRNIHMEGDASIERHNTIGIEISNMNSVLVDGVDYIGAINTDGDLIKISNASTNVVLRGLRAQSLLNLVNDTVNNKTLTVAGYPKLDYYSNGPLFMGTTNGQTLAPFTARQAGNGLEFGNPNAAGFGSNIGSTIFSGFPFLSFDAENDALDTYKTRGLIGRVFWNDVTNTKLKIGRLTNANAATQTPTNDLEIDNAGNVLVSALFKQGEGAALTIGSNTIVPTNSIHQVGAGLIKTITVPSGFTSGSISFVPTAAFTYDATGNILGTGAAVIGRTMIATYSASTSKWSMSY